MEKKGCLKMTKIVVVSDSHRNFDALLQTMEQNLDLDYMIHLGDGEREFDDLRALYPEKKLLNVRGNCDYGSETRDTDILICEKQKILFTHSHCYNGLGHMVDTAKAAKASMVLFGHTHRPLNSEKNGILLLNPGSVNDYVCPTYARIFIEDRKIVPEICLLRQPRTKGA